MVVENVFNMAKQDVMYHVIKAKNQLIFYIFETS